MSLYRGALRLAWNPVHRLLEKAQLWLIKKSCLGRVDGVSISDNSLARRSPDVFFKMTSEAMDLNKKLDPRRHRRICQQFDYIVNLELVEHGNYEQKLKICNVDFSQFPVETYPNRSRRRYACLLIHEATHGLLFEKGIPYNEDTWQQVEKICHLEEYRFAKRFEPGWADEHVGPFDPERWKFFRGPKEIQAAAKWKRFLEGLREAWNKGEKE